MSASSVVLKAPGYSQRQASQRPPSADPREDTDADHYDIFITGAAIAFILLGLMFLR